MQLEALLQSITEAVFSVPAVEALIAGRQTSHGAALPALGLRRSARLPVLAALYRRLEAPLLLLTDRADHALALLDELALWAPDAPRLFFPEPTPLFYENAAWGEATRRDRLMALTALAAYHIPGAKHPPKPPILIAPGRALMTRTLPRRDFLKTSRTLKLEQIIQPDELAHTCYALGYEAVNTVIASGQFARRGGIFDIWPPAEAQPVRLEFFGDEIDTLRCFDPASQRTLKSGISADSEAGLVNRILITPAREFILPLNAPAPKDGETFSEFDLPRLHPIPASLLDYLPQNAVVLVEDRQALEDITREVEEQAVAMRKDFIRDGTLPEDFPVPYLSWSEIQDSLAGHAVLDLGQPGVFADELPAVEGAFTAAGESFDLARRFSAGPRFGGQLKPLMAHLVERYQAGDAITIVSRQCARLAELWREQRIPPGPTPPSFVDGSLNEGWSFSPLQGGLVHLFTDGELFGWRRPEPRRRPRPAAEAPEASYADLLVGDYVVHVDHGIGRFQGLVQRSVDEVQREYLCVEYADEAQLFVPVHQADRLTRYVGPDNRSPSLSRLGSPEWKNVKSYVKEAVEEVAEDLLELYAKRSVVEGHSFSADTAWQQELEASFPYIETDDQVRVLKEVKQDMQRKRPMDRLICGDVGYGKTEVALRAAFKSVMDGKQVAMLVPTTVLAQQHFNTFHQRLAAFPVEVEMLSRFRTPQQQHSIINRLADGKIDIIIGTHRLFSSDVRFKDLGLLIIDEEQRFGVAHKEMLKKMRTEVDVLTLTATPIPRTLYMALSGIRDISTINTPPEERLPIVTHVGPYSSRLVRQAILREMERGGQVFFVHNRVQTIGAMRMHLEQLIPEARIAVAHGQMAETDLSQRMEYFSNGDVDVLLSTSIIESGLDIPNANTLIVDRADTFGLAQLYQLRGRVGRGAQRAYAYFFRHNKINPTLDGRQRLETIAENTQLGAGFSIAMRDLEIRGTGDILGTRQSGHIAAVGFHLYTSLLAEAVRRLRGEAGPAAVPLPPTLNLQLSTVNVDLPLPVGVPAEYVADKTARLGLYRRMADMKALLELDAMLEEFKDRFGPPPETVLNLFLQLKFKLLAEKAGLASITVESGQLALRFPDATIPEDLPDLGPKVRVGKVALWLPYSGSEVWQSQLVDVLIRLQRETAGSA
jgi:transcription-repair coupling factor (superfamily II helicase)